MNIEGLSKYEKLDSLPEDVLKIKRKSRYDKVVADARNGPVKLTFDNEKRANGVYLALRARISKNREKLGIRKVRSDVYLFPSKLIKE
jgi:hypothetical protein